MTPYRPDPKTPKPKVNKAYRIWISERRCAVCGAWPPNDPAHQNIDGGKMGGKADDKWLLPYCRDCHQASENRVNSGFMTLWQTKRPELWVRGSEDANPAKGLLFDRLDLRDYIKILCEEYYGLWLSKKR